MQVSRKTIVGNIDLSSCVIIFSPATAELQKQWTDDHVCRLWNVQPVYCRRKLLPVVLTLAKLPAENQNNPANKTGGFCTADARSNARTHSSIWWFYCICLLSDEQLSPGWFVIRKLLITLNNKLPLSGATNKHSRCLKTSVWESSFNESHIFT